MLLKELVTLSIEPFRGEEGRDLLRLLELLCLVLQAVQERLGLRQESLRGQGHGRLFLAILALYHILFGFRFVLTRIRAALAAALVFFE